MSVASDSVTIPAAGVELEADVVVVPPSAAGVVGFVHGSGSCRHSPRHRYVAAELQAAGLATVLADLLTPAEERTAELHFDIDLLAARTAAMVNWLGDYQQTAGLDVGLLGASTGRGRVGGSGATAGWGGGDRVSWRSNRPGRRAPGLGEPADAVIVGARDPVVLQLNQEAMTRLAGETRLEIVPGASHLVPEPGALEQVARLATAWFVRHLQSRAPRPPR